MDDKNPVPIVEIKTSYRIPRIGEEVHLVNPKGVLNQRSWLLTEVIVVDEKNKTFTTEWKIRYDDNSGIEIEEDTFPFDSYGILWFDKNAKLPVLGEHLNNYKWRNYGKRKRGNS